MKIYNFSFLQGFPVTFHLVNNHKSVWTRLHGIQIGDWFFGAIKGRVILPEPDSAEAILKDIVTDLNSSTVQE
jgi:hypothetical protein